jgi:hypothetical protein
MVDILGWYIETPQSKTGHALPGVIGSVLICDQIRALRCVNCNEIETNAA